MQDKNLINVKLVLQALADHVKVKGIRGLATFLGVNENNLYAWIKRGRVGDTGIILSKCPEVRLGWLETGTGEMFESKFKQFALKLEDGGRTKEPDYPYQPGNDPLLTEDDLRILSLLKNDPEKYLAVKDLIKLNNEEVRETRAEMWQLLKKRKEGP